EVLPLSNDRGELHVLLEDGNGNRAVHVDDGAARQATTDVPTLVSTGWSVSEAVSEAVTAATAVIILDPTDPVIAHAVGAIKASVPEARFVDARDHGAEQIVTAVKALS